MTKAGGEEEAIDHGDEGDADGWFGDGSETNNWLGAIAGHGERERKNRIARISEWAATAGEPHAEVLLGDDPECMDRVGLWKVPRGIVRIRASRKGDFDPAERTIITNQEVQAIMDANGRDSVHKPSDDVDVVQ